MDPALRHSTIEGVAPTAVFSSGFLFLSVFEMATAHRLLHTVLAAALLVAMSACADGSLTDAAPEMTLVGPTWTLAGFEAPDGSVSRPGSEAIRVTFAPEGEVNGRSSTNRFGGTYRTGAPRQLSIETLETTLASVPQGSRYTEFYSALRAALAYEVGGEALRIAYGSEGRALRFARAAGE